MFRKGNLKERDNLEDLAFDGMIILKPCIKLITYGKDTNKFLLTCKGILYHIMYNVCLLREVYCKGYITKLFKSMYDYRILSFKNTWFKIYIEL